MTLLDQLLLLSALTVLLTLLLGAWSFTGWLATLLYAGQGVLLWQMSGLGYVPLQMVESSLTFQIMGQTLYWRFDALSWFFAVITVGAGLCTSWFSAGEWGAHYRRRGGRVGLIHFALALNVFSMLVLLASGDLLSLFIGWELVSWASFLIMALGGSTATRYAMRYLSYAIAGAMAMLAALALIFSITGNFQFDSFRTAVPTLSSSMLWLLFGLFASGFGIKMALLPFHLWQAKAYAETAGPGAAFLGAISSRMGLFAILLVLVQLIGIARLAEMDIPYSFLSARELLAWIAALTVILPTFTALQQHDARRLLAWHGIGQGGYMLLGIMIADDLGSAGGLMHVFNHATYQALLFLVVTAVIHRVGTSDLNKLGGLVARMPVSFFLLLIGIIGLAGLPPMNGFVSKWLIYRSLIMDANPLLFVASVVGTLGTILSVYKLIHNIFLGQLRLEHRHVEEVPWSMLLPMILLATVVFLTGYFPGLILDWISVVQASVGLPVLEHHLGGVAVDKGGLDMIWIVSVLLAGFVIGALIFFAGGRSKRVHQLDNYAGGHFLTADTRFQYSDNFYPGLMHLIAPWYRKSFRWLERGLVSFIDFLAMVIQGLYRHTHPAFYLLVVMVITLTWVLKP